MITYYWKQLKLNAERELRCTAQLWNAQLLVVVITSEGMIMGLGDRPSLTRDSCLCFFCCSSHTSSQFFTCPILMIYCKVSSSRARPFCKTDRNSIKFNGCTINLCTVCIPCRLRSMKDHSEVEAFYACKQPLHFRCSVVELQILPILAMQGFWERTLYQPLSYCKKCIYMYALYLSVQKYLFISNWSTNHKMLPRATLEAWKQSAAAFTQFKVQRGNFIFSATHKLLTLGLSTKYPTPTLAQTQSCINFSFWSQNQPLKGWKI